MKIPISWIKEYVDIDGVPLEELAHTITMAGLEVEEIRYVGLAMPEGEQQQTKISGLSWNPETIVVAEIREVGSHPDADRLVLCRLWDGQQEHTVLTGAPNLFEYKGQGELKPPLKVAYAKEGAEIYDGHQDGFHKTILKRAKIRGVESYSMVASEKELGISEEHEGIMFLPAEAEPGTPLADYMGDAVLDIAITPNIARLANVYGIAREIAAILGRKLKPMPTKVKMEGEPVKGKVKLEISKPELNPRFVLGLVQGVKIEPSPEWVQRRLRLAGMRPINNIVDATNYAMLEVGEPLHAFDYDVLVERAKGKTPTISTRTAKQGETLMTLDDVERTLDDFTVLVCDTAGPLSIGGVMGGLESEVTEQTTNVLLEGAAWNFINIRRTLNSQRMSSEAAYRFSRGVHPEMAPRGVSRGLELMRQWAGGTVDEGLIDEYPLPPEPSVVTITPTDVQRWLGIELSATEIADILKRLEFEVTKKGDTLTVTAPDHRVDIGEGVIGQADLMEEIARIYGYERIPETLMEDALPPQRINRALEVEERVRDILVSLGYQEAITYRLTSAEDEARRLPPDVEPDPSPYLALLNTISPERALLRKSLLASVLAVVEGNARVRERLAFFEIGPVFRAAEESPLPEELSRLVLAITGPREPAHWEGADQTPMVFYDLKGGLTTLLAGLHIEDVTYASGEHPAFHPGKCARILQGETQIGVFGELHPLVQAHYDFGEHPVLAAALNMDVILRLAPSRFESDGVPNYPPVLEDMAFIVDEDLPAGDVQSMIAQTGGSLVSRVQLFDVYRGEQVGSGKKSLAYQLVYQHPERTLTDDEVAKVRQRIAERLQNELGAQLRS